MIRARIPISRTAEGLWKAGPSSVELGSDRRIPITATAPEETLADLVETVMGEALLCLDKNGRRGTSEAIEWEIVIDQVPYCYRCIEPMQPSSQPSSATGSSASREWKCAECGTAIQFG
jgi:hypothetical protein